MSLSSTLMLYFLLVLIVVTITLLFELHGCVKKDENYEDLIDKYNEEIEDYQEELDEVIEAKSQTNNYDYSKLLDNMDYRELLEGYLPELLEPVQGHYKSPAVTALNEIEYNERRISELDKIHQNINTIRWWYNFSNE